MRKAAILTPSHKPKKLRSKSSVSMAGAQKLLSAAKPGIAKKPGSFKVAHKKQVY
jgi:hypothetical protein